MDSVSVFITKHRLDILWLVTVVLVAVMYLRGDMQPDQVVPALREQCPPCACVSDASPE